MSRTGALVAGAAIAVMLTAGCSKGPSENTGPQETSAPATPTFDGLPISGTAELAKKNGFTECYEQERHFVCKKLGVKLFGIASEYVSVIFDSEGSVNKNLAATQYSGLIFKIPTAREDPACEKKRKAKASRRDTWADISTGECSIPGLEPELVRQLIAAGWIEGGYSRRERWFFGKDKGYSFQLKQSGVVRLEPISMTNPDQFQDLQEAASSARAASKAKSAFAEQMAASK